MYIYTYLPYYFVLFHWIKLIELNWIELNPISHRFTRDKYWNHKYTYQRFHHMRHNRLSWHPYAFDMLLLLVEPLCNATKYHFEYFSYGLLSLYLSLSISSSRCICFLLECLQVFHSYTHTRDARCKCDATFNWKKSYVLMFCGNMNFAFEVEAIKCEDWSFVPFTCP